MLRQGARFVAIYLSDLLLWLSLASIGEIVFVLFAGTLCILTAGFIFEGMKKNPLVLVLGSALALTGTFLVFREVRGLVWPAAPAVAEKISPSNMPKPLPGPLPNPLPGPTSATPTPGGLSDRLRPQPSAGDSACAGLSTQTCYERLDCYWSIVSSRCMGKLRTSSDPFAATATATSCGLQSKLTCSLMAPCYWSALTSRCEVLKFGTSLIQGQKPPSAPSGHVSCSGKRELECAVSVGCQWSPAFARCYERPSTQTR